ncbi:MAG: YqgE/AlgH family protein [Planctomycetales bacterium]
MAPSSLSGHFLIAGKNLRDPNFFQSVVLMIEHNDQGAMGLVINRPAGLTVSKVLEGHFDLPDTNMQVYAGGPVERSALFILHDSGDYDPSQSSVVPGLYVGNSAEIFENVVRRAVSGDDNLKFRIYAGCSGWAPNQLEQELERGDWLVTKAQMELVFHEDPYAVWDLLMKEVHQAPALPVTPHIPPAPEWN